MSIDFTISVNLDKGRLIDIIEFNDISEGKFLIFFRWGAGILQKANFSGKLNPLLKSLNPRMNSEAIIRL